MGNSRKHRLEMSASLINALPIEANAKTILTNPIILGSCAAIIAIITFFLFLRCTQALWMKRIHLMNSKKDVEALKMKNRQIPVMNFQSTRQKSVDNVKIQISKT
ncbi:hypothetical protein PVAND_003547 [Polypedilum vanderplanki]|uniref:Uncharacterized protein n=1 Tax=Polypedilum vanderplanki TaxID=319348 RepID=A0A9J6BUD2_POLVA|nr:hypothetical protein PVAND_003547 [Polypedilum vanderplanki]